MTGRLRLLLAAALLPLVALPAPADAAWSPDAPPSVATESGPDTLPFYPQQFLPSWLMPVGDLDLNGVKDVVEVRDPDPYGDRTRDVRLIARDGRRGVELWRRTVNVPEQDSMQLAPFRLAGSGRPALLLHLFRSTLLPLRPGEITRQAVATRMVALDLRANTVAWRASLGSTIYQRRDASGRCEPCTSFGGLVQATSGTGQDLLVHRTVSGPPSQRPNPDPTSPDIEVVPGSEVQVLRYSGASGQVIARSAQVAVDHSEPRFAVTPDLDLDGQDDVLLVSAQGRGFTAVGGRSGAVLWRTGALAPGLHPTLVGGALRLDGGRDLVVTTHEGDNPEQADGYQPQPGRPQVALLDGLTGAVVWRRPGVEARVLGEDVAVLRVVNRVDGETTTSTATVTGVDRSGLDLWSRTQTLTATVPGRQVEPIEDENQSSVDSLLIAHLREPGDVDSDGVRDVVLVHQRRNGDVVTVEDASAVLSGAHGGVLHDRPVGTPQELSLTGSGADLAMGSAVKGRGAVLSARDGLTGAPLWRVAIPRSTNLSWLSGIGTQLFAGRCGSVLVAGSGRAASGVVSGSGVVRWVVYPGAGYDSVLVAGTATASTCG